MKITKQQLKQIIKEEIEEVLKEDTPWHPGALREPPRYRRNPTTEREFLPGDEAPFEGGEAECKKLRRELNDHYKKFLRGKITQQAWDRRRKGLELYARKLVEQGLVDECVMVTFDKFKIPSGAKLSSLFEDIKMKITKQQLKQIIKEELERFLQENPQLLEEGWKDWARKAALGAATIGALGGAPAMAATPEKPAVTQQVRGEFTDAGPQADFNLGETEILKRDVEVRDGEHWAVVTVKHVETGVEKTGEAKIRSKSRINLAFTTATARARAKIAQELQPKTPSEAN